MRTTYWVPGARGRGISLAAGLVLLCFAGTMVGSSPALGAEAPKAESGLLRMGDGYAHRHGSTRVRALQRRLRTLALRPGPIDGRFGPRTESAVERLQRAAGLRVDGIVGARTRAVLRRASAPLLGRRAGYHEPGGSLQVRRLQRKLRRLGLRPGPIDGRYGPLTAAAVARFQRARGVTPDGVAWSRTRHAIVSASSISRARARNNRPASESTLSRRVLASMPGSAVPIGATPVADAEQERGGFPLLAVGTLLTLMLVLVTASWTRRATRPRRRSAGWSLPLPVAQRTADHVEVEGVEAIGYVTMARPGDDTDLEVLGQITAVDAECAKRGWRLVEVVCDVGDASDRALSRPGLRHALRRVGRSRTPYLIVAELCRLGTTAAGLGRVLRRMREDGMRLVAADVDLDTGANRNVTAGARVMAGVGGGPTAAGQGDSNGSGRPRRPGRRAVGDVPDLKARIVAMRSAGMTLQAIADRLNEEGVPTVRGGREWRPSSVQVAAGYRRPRRLSRPGRGRTGQGRGEGGSGS